MQFWHQKNAIVSGGSSGLGFAIAKQLAAFGANVTIIGRNAERLAQAATSIQAKTPHANLQTFACDVAESSASDLRSLLGRNLHRVDLLVNAVGKSDRGWLMQLNDQDHRDLFSANVLSGLHMVDACGSGLAEAHGCVVNIGSLASLFAPRGVGGYAVAKFALAAATEQLRRELKASHVRCLLVCPGPILPNEDSSGSAEATASMDRYAEVIKRRNLPEELRAPGSGAKLKGLRPDRLATEILKAAQTDRKLLIRPRKAHLLRIAAAISPTLGDWLLQRFSE